MANAKIIIDTQIKGGAQLDKLQRNLKSVSKESKIAASRLNSLQTAAARGRASFSALATTLKVGVAAGLATVAFGVTKFVRGTIEAGNTVERARIQFNSFFGDVEKGGQSFDVLNDFASTVPFTLDEILKGGTALAAISDGPLELGKNLKLVGNLAATANLSFSDAALQYQRVASAGVAAADLLRDRGVSGLLEFQSGVRYSVEESVKVFEGAFLNGGRFSKVSNDLANTLQGNVSMFQDFVFQFQAATAKPLFEALTAQVKELVGDFRANDKALKDLAARVGTGLGTAFGTAGKIIRSLVDNFDLLVTAIKTLLALKVTSMVVNMGVAFVTMGARIKVATTTMGIFNAVTRANPIGAVITLLQGAVIAFIAFEDQILQIVDTIKNYFVKEIKLTAKNLLELISKLKIFPKFAKNAEEGAKQIAKELDEMAFKASEAGKELERLNKIPRFRDDQIKVSAPMIMGEANNKKATDASKAAAEAEKKFKEDIAATNQRISNMNRDFIRQEAADRAEYSRQTQEQVVAYRKKLASVGIESKKIGDIVGTTWVNGIREGNSLLENTKNSFKNVALSIAETLVKKSSELLIEQLFLKFADQKIIKQRQLNSEVSNQGNIMDTLVGKSKNLLGSLTSGIGSLFGGGGPGAGMGGSFGMGGGGSKMGALFSIGRSFLGFNEGGIVPGGAPYTDRIPAMLTPGEVVVPRDKANSGSMGGTNITNINISGNVDQRSIDQIKAVISSSSSEVGGANRGYQANTKGIRGRNI